MADVSIGPDLPAAKPASPHGSISNRSNNRSSTASFDSLRRHHARNSTVPRRVKETLNARSEYTNSVDDSSAEHRINQYLIKQEIGRGSFGAVRLAIDQFGNEYAVKEFSKSRLRKRAQSHVLRHMQGARRSAGTGFNSPLHMHPEGNEDGMENPLHLIQGEIAIMKKLHHNNLVALIEVLDDPTEDSLYMVMEMCKKGVIMKIAIGEHTDPYDDERCRCWFRDLILAIEYLHAQGIVHRDIKPDNCLLTEDDILKVVDFGVSEMFEKNSAMYTAKSVGSPAFLPPELCVAKHGDVSGTAADIWSMGVTLYCLRYGRLPFAKEAIFELYESIRNDEVNLDEETNDDFKDLMKRILEKDPEKRIKIPELRVHPWVTKNGTEPLISAEENTAEIVSPPTEEEVNNAITKNMNHVLAVVKAVQKFKRLIEPPSPKPMKSILGEGIEAHFVQPPLSINDPDDMEFRFARTVPQPTPARPHAGQPLEISTSMKEDTMAVCQTSPSHSGQTQQRISIAYSAAQSPVLGTHNRGSLLEGTRGHARNPLEEEYPYLFIGPSRFTGRLDDEDFCDLSQNEPGPVDDADTMVVSESPGAAEIDIYETAYQEEIERIKKRSQELQAPAPTIYLTRRVEGKSSGLSDLLRQATQQQSLSSGNGGDHSDQGAPSLLSVASKIASTKFISTSVSPSAAITETTTHAETGSSSDQVPSHSNTVPSSFSQAISPSGTIAPSMPTSAMPTTETTATTVMASAPPSSERSSSGLRNLLDKVRQTR
ncbi:hypothetical protein VTO42DRAFT_3259 [Malbranchea cinnamomea]